jgi:hypothetical protein
MKVFIDRSGWKVYAYAVRSAHYCFLDLFPARHRNRQEGQALRGRKAYVPLSAANRKVTSL